MASDNTSDDTPCSENLYDAPSADLAFVGEPLRPAGVAVLSVLTAIMGCVFLTALVVLVVNWEENNVFALSRRIAPTVFWGMIGLSIVMSFVASFAMWRGRKWGWWIACSGMVLFIGQNITGAATANLSGGAPSFATFVSDDSLKFVLRGIFFVYVLAYWLRPHVRSHFHVENTSKFKAVVLSSCRP